MLIDTTLLVNNPEIIKCLLDGSMKRYGSVIRWAAGTENAGHIVRHLAEAPGLTSKLVTLPFAPIARLFLPLNLSTLIAHCRFLAGANTTHSHLQVHETTQLVMLTTEQPSYLPLAVATSMNNIIEQTATNTVVELCGSSIEQV